MNVSALVGPDFGAEVLRVGFKSGVGQRIKLGPKIGKIKPNFSGLNGMSLRSTKDGKGSSLGDLGAGASSTLGKKIQVVLRN